MSAVIALDLGGTHLRAATARADRPDELQSLGHWPASKDLPSFRARLADILSGDRAARIGVAAPGLTRGTQCRWIPNLPWLDGVDLADLAPGRSIALGNDAQLALLAEARLGAASDLSDAILLSIGTGVGSAVLVDRRIVKGAGGGACSFGWACADLEDKGHPSDGWLERNAAGRALDAAAAEVIGTPDGAQLVAAARGGEIPARAAIDRAATSIGVALAGVVGLLDPQAIVITGGVAAALDVVSKPLLEALRRQLPRHLQSIELRAGRFGAQAALVGAAVAGFAGPEWGRIR
jgi:glucokinase